MVDSPRPALPEVTVFRSPRNDAGLTKIALVLGLAGTVVVGAGGAALLSSSGNPDSSAVGIDGAPTPLPTPGFAVTGSRGATVPWSTPLTFSVTDATITSLSVASTTGVPLEGALTSVTSWASNSTLLPSTAYRLRASIKDRQGKTSTVDRVIRSSAATQVVHASVSPGKGVFGIGQPVIVRFDQKIKGAAARAAVIARLKVTTAPSVEGAWRWYNSFEVHYRGHQYWPSGATISTTASLAGLRVPGTDIWGAMTPVAKTFSIDRAFVSTVDIAKHTMTTTLDGKVVRVIKVSTGRDIYPTKGGVHIVLTREKSHTYNSGTVGIPTAGPGGYYEKLPWSMRISNGGAFVHANPDTVGVQGIRNVSHGCVNTSVADARWFYDNTHLGDIVNVINAVVKPVQSDAGMYDWNYTWDEWRAGNLTG
jgi:lipoprotein-anchoring transpeptidase ErfK/SrfK